MTAAGAVRAALTNLFVGDALAMPVHWYYNPGDILRAFPPHGIRSMEAAPAHHPSSIMSLHSTRRGGRSGRERLSPSSREIVGEVILKGRREHWGVPNRHYHHGMPAGENTLNAWWARRLMAHLAEHGDYDLERWARDYVAFMTADPPAHPDTYAESCHRGFFANLDAGRPLLECGARTHDTPSMGALVTLAPLALALLPRHSIEVVQKVCREHVRLTHPSDELLAVVHAYVALLARLRSLSDTAPARASGRAADEATNAAPGESREACDTSGGEAASKARIDAFAEAAAVVPGTRLAPLLAQRGGDAAVVGRRYSLACYIEDSWPSVCYLAAKYHADPERALRVNANLGGENAHRGAVLGTLVGLASGRVAERLAGQLHRGGEIAADIERWAARFDV